MDVVSVPCFLSVSSVSGVHCYGLVQRLTSCAVGVFSCTDRLSCGFWEWTGPWVLGVVLQLPPSFRSLAAVVRWVSVQHLNPEAAFNLRCGEAGPFWIVGFHNCQAAKPPPPPAEHRESWEFNYDGILALDPARLKRSLMGGLSFRTKTQEPPNTLRKIIILHYVQFALH